MISFWRDWPIRSASLIFEELRSILAQGVGVFQILRNIEYKDQTALTRGLASSYATTAIIDAKNKDLIVKFPK